MDGKRISQLTPDTSPTTDDFIVTVDGSTTQNKRVELGNLPVSNLQNDALDLKLNISDNRVELRGVGFPNGVVTAPVGTTYVDTNATNGAVAWVKATGTGNTGWQVLEGDTGWRDVTSLPGGLYGGWTGTLKIRRTGGLVTIRSMFETDGINGTAATQNSFYAPTAGFRMDTVGNDAISAASSNRLLPPDGTVYRNTVNLACTLRTAQAGFYASYTTDDAWPITLP